MPDRWPGLMRRKDAIEYLGVSDRFFTNLVAAGRLRGVKFDSSGHPKYKRADLDDFIESLEYGSGYCAATQDCLDSKKLQSK